MTSPSDLARRARVATCRGEFDRQRVAFAQWFDTARKSDAREQHKTQLDTLETVLIETLAALEADIPTATGGRPIATLYSDCRAAEARLFELRRLWIFYKDRFDQRADPVVGPVLRAADEVVWAAMQCAVRRYAGRDGAPPPPPMPLAYIEPHFSPTATPRVDPPPDLRPALVHATRRLPIPLIGLPPLCVANPWMLVLIGHETGHHIQYDLVEHGALLRTFQDTLAAAVEQAAAQNGLDGAERSARWREWHREIFADLYGVLAFGPWAAWAMAELAFAADMTRPLSLYPPAIVRIALLEALGARLGPHGIDILHGETLDGLLAPCGDGPRAEEARRDLDLVAVLAEALPNRPLEPAGSLAWLCALAPADFAPTGPVAGFGRAFFRGDDIHPAQDIRAPRHAIAGAVAAWATAAAREADEDALARRREALAAAVIATLPECAEPGTRAGSATRRADVDAIAGDLTAAIRLAQVPPPP